MRTILFRGKTIDGNWVGGLLYFSHGCGEYKISHSNGWQPSYSNPDEGEETILTSVISETIGQFTGTHDKYIREIFEGDIIRIQGGENYNGIRELDKVCVVKFLGSSFYAVSKNDVCYDLGVIEEIEVLGNIYDNKNLIK